MNYQVIIYFIVVISAVMAVMSKKLLNSAIMLAITSIAVSLILFSYNAPWAGVFELSVCAGLITVLFISAISLMKKEDSIIKENYVKYIILPFLVIIMLIISGLYILPYFEYLTNYSKYSHYNPSVGDIIWHYRSIDIIGQITLLACAVFVIKSIFYKRRNEN